MPVIPRPDDAPAVFGDRPMILFGKWPGQGLKPGTGKTNKPGRNRKKFSSKRPYSSSN